MAGSYNHCVTNTGNLSSNDTMVGRGAMIENLGDAYEAIEEMYGMIWFLARHSAIPHIPTEDLKSFQFGRETVKDLVELARQHYQEGLEVSKEIHKHSPDRRRD